MPPMFNKIILTIVLIAFVTLVAFSSMELLEDDHDENVLIPIFQTQSVSSEKFMISAANPVATQAGYDVLKRGGTAVDAAVAVQLMLNLVEPQSSGIGGGAFMVYWDATSKTLTTFDGRERAPLSATPQYWFGIDGKPVKWFDAVVGGKSVGVPGTLKLLETVQQRFGNQNWAELLEPAKSLAETGFKISPRLAMLIADHQGSRKLDIFGTARTYFFDESGAPRKAGEILKNPDFASALGLLQAEGSKPFYEGQIARDIIAAVKTVINPGVLTMEDMKSYQVVERQPACAPYRQYDVCGMGPPSSGGLTVGQILSILSHYDLPEMESEIDRTHLYIEASRLAFADRAQYMADSDYTPMPQGLLDQTYLGQRAALIDPDETMGKAKAGSPPWELAMLRSPDTQRERAGTSHFSIVDAKGNIVSMTTTIESGFGSRVMTNGFILNNELTDFSRIPEKDAKPIANRVEGGKRPRSSMAPTIVLKDGVPVLAIGSPGGSRIISFVAEAIIRILDQEMDPQLALNLPHVVNRNGTTDIEQNPGNKELISELEERGHEFRERAMVSGLHAIVISPNGLTGGADPRREGVVMGE
ncbi:MAG: gamma-glutamyltransferase [Cohaesibacteraceae bacterium]|nr:gamma-glutamyltransferase [Cohaesibacteraceae bacterium]